MFTAEKLSAEEARQLCMVKEVVPADELREFSQALAQKIAQQDVFSLLMAKLVVNQTLDVMGQPPALQAGFYIHKMQLTHCLARWGGETAVLTRGVSKLQHPPLLFR